MSYLLVYSDISLLVVYAYVLSIKSTNKVEYKVMT